MNDPDIRDAVKEAIDACRPGTDDVNLPEMSALADLLRDDEQVRGWYDHTQRSDAAIARAFRDIPIPDGLSDRLVSSINKEGAPIQAPSSLIEDAIQEKDEPESVTNVALPTKGWYRRRRWVICGATVAAVAVVFAVLFPWGNREILPEELRAEVTRWIDEESQSADWREDVTEAAPLEYPDDAEISGLTPNGWCVIGTRYDSQTIVYDVSRRGERAYLFCFRTNGRSVALPNTIPLSPRWTTGGVDIGAWQRNGMMYVLAVEGGRQQYQRYVTAMEIG